MSKTTYFISSEIEANAMEQVVNAEEFDDIDSIAVYPDIHYCAEKAIPIGLAFSTKDAIFPLITGKDMGCGVSYLRIPKSDVLRPFDKGEHYASLSHHQNFFTDERLGGGNHFLSIEEDDGNWYVICHTGTRNRGIYMYQVNRGILTEVGNDAFVKVTDLLTLKPTWFDDYDRVVEYGRERRRQFCYRTLQYLINSNYVSGNKMATNNVDFREFKGYEYSDSVHNHIKREGDSYIHRKGSTELNSDTVVIPLSMTRGSLLVKKAYEDERALNSCSHGAGRKLSRMDTLKHWHTSLKEKERKAYMNRFSEMLGRNGKFPGGYLQEFDFAYKDSDAILTDQPFLKKVTATTPIVTFKFTEI